MIYSTLHKNFAQHRSQVHLQSQPMADSVPRDTNSWDRIKKAQRKYYLQIYYLSLADSTFSSVKLS